MIFFNVTHFMIIKTWHILWHIYCPYTKKMIWWPGKWTHFGIQNLTYIITYLLSCTENMKSSGEALHIFITHFRHSLSLHIFVIWTLFGYISVILNFVPQNAHPCFYTLYIIAIYYFSFCGSCTLYPKYIISIDDIYIKHVFRSSLQP